MMAAFDWLWGGKPPLDHQFTNQNIITMRLIVYSVICTYVDDIMQGDVDNIFPTAESAIAHAKKIAASSSIYEVHVNKDEVTEQYGRHWLATVYREKHEERYL